jgi:hypothetical protein
MCKRPNDFLHDVAFLERFAKFLRDAVMVTVRQGVAGGDDQRDRPLDDLGGSQDSKADVVRQFLHRRNLDLPNDRKIHGNAFSLTNPLRSASVR